MLSYTAAFVLIQAVLAVQGGNPFQKTRPANDIEALCTNKPVALLTATELEYLNTIVGGSSCSSNVKAAIPDLLTLIKLTEDNLCAQGSISRLREFYSKYLDTSSEESKQREQLPKSLRKFALAYGMQMSSVCKKRMVKVLLKAGHNVFHTDQHKAIGNLVSTKSPVADMLEGLAGPDEILLPVDLAPYIKEKYSEDGVVYVQSATGPYIREMQANCTQDFAPIYRPLIKPIVQLTNMGFNYKDELLRDNMSDLKTLYLLGKWSRLVFLCESLNNIRMVDVPKQTNPADTAEGETVRILTKEEAAAIDDKSVSEPQPRVVEYPYAPVVWRNQLVYNKDDRKLKRAIKAFSTSKSEEEKIAKRMMGKGISMIKTQLKRHNFGVLLSTGYKSIVHRIRTGETLNPSDEIVKILDGAIGHESDYQDTRQVELGANWESAKEISKEIGAKLAAAVGGILIIAVTLFCIGVVAVNGFLLFSAFG